MKKTLSSQAVQVLQTYLDMGAGPQDIANLIDSFREDHGQLMAAAVWIEESITGRSINEKSIYKGQTWDSPSMHIQQKTTRLLAPGVR